MMNWKQLCIMFLDMIKGTYLQSVLANRTEQESRRPKGAWEFLFSKNSNILLVTKNSNYV